MGMQLYIQLAAPLSFFTNCIQQEKNMQKISAQPPEDWLRFMLKEESTDPQTRQARTPRHHPQTVWGPKDSNVKITGRAQYACSLSRHVCTSKVICLITCPCKDCSLYAYSLAHRK